MMYILWPLVGGLSMFLFLSIPAYKKYKNINAKSELSAYKEVTAEYNINLFMIGMLGGFLTPAIIILVSIFDFMSNLFTKLISKQKGDFFARALQKCKQNTDRKQNPEKYL